MKQAALEKYLSNYGQSADITDFPNNKTWRYVLILPVCGEQADCVDTLFKKITSPSVLLIIVLNRPEPHDKSLIWQQQNEVFKSNHCERYKQKLKLSEYCTLLQNGDLPDTLMLDYNNHPFDASQGVGLARRIGADTACELMAKNMIEKSWLYSTDADVTLPLSYFELIEEYSKAAALSLLFEHESDDAELTFLQHLYDFKLHYYRDGVRFIGAQYDYIPLGSTLIVNANAYAQVRGFPIRSGGEDFYLLNKLAKVGVIEQPNEPMIKIRARKSERVPFGTGPGLSRIEAQLSSNEDIRFYHPEVFVRLKTWYHTLQTYYASSQLPDDAALNQNWDIKTVLLKAKKQCKSEARWQQFMHEWFDAFKILKSVHFLEKFYSPQTLTELMESESFHVITDSQYANHFNKFLE